MNNTCEACKRREGEITTFWVGEELDRQSTYMGTTHGVSSTTHRYHVTTSYGNFRMESACICSECVELEPAGICLGCIIFMLIFICYLFNLLVDVSSGSIRFNPHFSEYGPQAVVLVFRRAAFWIPSVCFVFLYIFLGIGLAGGWVSKRFFLMMFPIAVDQDIKDLYAIKIRKKAIKANWNGKNADKIAFFTKEQYSRLQRN